MIQGLSEGTGMYHKATWTPSGTGYSMFQSHVREIMITVLAKCALFANRQSPSTSVEHICALKSGCCEACKAEVCTTYYAPDTVYHILSTV